MPRMGISLQLDQLNQLKCLWPYFRANSVGRDTVGIRKGGYQEREGQKEYCRLYANYKKGGMKYLIRSSVFPQVPLTSPSPPAASATPPPRPLLRPALSISL